MSQQKDHEYEDIETRSVDEVRIKNLRQRLKKRPRGVIATPDQASSDEFQEEQRKKKVTFQAKASSSERPSRMAAIKQFSQEFVSYVLLS